MISGSETDEYDSMTANALNERENLIQRPEVLAVYLAEQKIRNLDSLREIKNSL